MIQFLVENPLFAILLCMGVGYSFGKINLGVFPNNATLGTLYAAIALNIVISASGATFDAEHVRVMKTFFFALFTFALGYDAGPVFRNSIRTSGIKESAKLVVLSLFYCICVFVCAFVIANVFQFGGSGTSGLLAGSQTQSTILNSESDVVAYALTYILATLGLIIFVQKAAPLLVGMDLISAVKARMGVGSADSNESAAVIMPVQIRAYRVDADSPYNGQTIDELEIPYEGRLQIESVYRGGVELELKQSQVVLASDVIVVAGPIRDIDLFDNHGLTETTEEDYVSFEMTTLEVVVSEKRVEKILYQLSDRGILINWIRRKGKDIAFSETTVAEKGDILSVTGRTQAILKSVEDIGYVKEEGDSADVPLLLLPLALAIPVGLISFPGTSLTLGTSCCALILGMIVGCIHDSKPRIAYLSTGAKWLLKSIGLNLFVASTALERALLPREIFAVRNLYIVLAGVILILLPATLTVLFGRLILRLASADVLGGLCGCATSTWALNSLSETTGSTIFTVGYAPAYVTSNICLTLVGSILISLI